jgi:hypothetical protein
MVALMSRKVKEIDKKDARKGKKYILILIAIINFYYSISFIANLDTRQTRMLLKQILALVIIATVTFLFFKGFKIAAWISFALLVQPALTILYYPFHYLGILERFNGWLMIIPAVLVGLIGVLILEKNNSINEFMKYQKEKRKFL